MAKKTRTRRSLKAVSATPVAMVSLDGEESRTWEKLVRDLRTAEARRAAAMRQLFAAERRYFAPQPKKKAGSEPDWYLAARQAEIETAAVLERLSRRIVRTRATTRDALAVKVRLVADAYGVNLGRDGAADREDGDLGACLIRSLLLDLG
jgi:hypothetical protein